MKKLLLQSCCAPCSTHVIDILKSEYQLTIFYYNPNIYPDEEYQKRLSEQKRYANVLGINVIEEKYDEKEFLSFVKGHESDSEGGDRCALCFELRLLKTAKKAKELGFDVFATTLTVSPHKDSDTINKIGLEIAKKIGIEFLDKNFKKQDGYLKSIKLSKQFNLYRQNYCGCRFSIRKDNV